MSDADGGAWWGDGRGLLCFAFSGLREAGRDAAFKIGNDLWRGVAIEGGMGLWLC